MGEAGIVVPVFADQALEAAGEGQVLVGAEGLRQEAVGVERRLLAGVAVEFGTGGGAVVVGAEGVGLDVTQGQLAVEPGVDVAGVAVAAAAATSNDDIRTFAVYCSRCSYCRKTLRVRSVGLGLRLSAAP